MTLKESIILINKQTLEIKEIRKELEKELKGIENVENSKKIIH